MRGGDMTLSFSFQNASEYLNLESSEECVIDFTVMFILGNFFV